MTCYECGKKIDDNIQDCPWCGAPQAFTEELLARARDNDQDALGQLYEMTYNNVYMTIRMMVKDEDTVYDLLQDTFLRAFNHLDRLGRPEAFRGWVKRIAHNLAVDHLRKKQPVNFSSMTAEDSDEEIDFADERPMSMPEEILDAQETTRLLNEILDALPEEQRAVVAMFYYEQIPVKRIAEMLGVSENTVKSRLMYARKKIEASVRDLEKKGTKLYSLSPIPFLLYLFRCADNQVMRFPDGRILQNVYRGHDKFQARQSARMERPDDGDVGESARSGRGRPRAEDTGCRSERAGRTVGSRAAEAGARGTRGAAKAAAAGAAKTAAGAAGKSGLAKVIIGVLAAGIVGGGATLGVLVYRDHSQSAAEAAQTAGSAIVEGPLPTANIVIGPPLETDGLAVETPDATEGVTEEEPSATEGVTVEEPSATEGVTVEEPSATPQEQTAPQEQAAEQPTPEAAEQPVPVTDGDRTVLQGTLKAYTSGEILTMQGRQDVLNSGYPTDQTVWAITLDQPAMVTGGMADESGITREATMIGLDEGAGLESYDGQHVVFSIDPDATWWPTDMSMPLEQPHTNDVHILSADSAADTAQAASEAGPVEVTIENYAGEYVHCATPDRHMYIEPDGAGGWRVRFQDPNYGEYINSPLTLGEDDRFYFDWGGETWMKPQPDGTIYSPGQDIQAGHFIPVTNPPNTSATLEDYLGSYTNGDGESLSLWMDGDTLCCTTDSREVRYADYEIWEGGTLYVYNTLDEKQWPDPYCFVLLQDGSLDAWNGDIREGDAAQGIFSWDSGEKWIYHPGDGGAVTVQDFLGVYRNGYFGLSLGLRDDGTLYRSLKTASHGGIDGATPYASYEVRDGVLYCNDPEGRPEGSDQFTLLEDGTLDARFYDDDYMNGIFQPDDGSVFET